MVSNRKNRTRSIFSHVGEQTLSVKYLFKAKTKSFLGETRRGTRPRTHNISSPSSSAYHSNIKEFYFPIRFTRHDFIALCLAILIPVTCIVLTMVSVLPALGAPPLPDFQDPTKVSNFNFGRPEEPAILISKLEWMECIKRNLTKRFTTFCYVKRSQSKASAVGARGLLSFDRSRRRSLTFCYY